MTRDDLLFKVAQDCKDKNIGPERAICDIISEIASKDSFSINLRGSSLVAFESNGLHFAVQQFLKVFYGANHNTLVGNAVHDAADFSYKHKMQTGKTPKLRYPIKEILRSSKKQFELINPDLRESLELRKLQILAIKLYKVYHKNVIPYREVVATEEKLKLGVPAEFFKHPKNVGKIHFTGTLDRIFKDYDGKLILSDLKTSGKRIGASVPVLEVLLGHRVKLKDLESIAKSLTKKIEGKQSLVDEKKTNDIEKIDLSNSLSHILTANKKFLSFEIKKDEEKLAKALEEKRATRSIESKIAKNSSTLIETVELLKKYSQVDEEDYIPDELTAYKKILNSLISLEKRIVINTEKLKELNEHEVSLKNINNEIKELAYEMQPLENDYKILKLAEDTKAARNQYGKQLAFYAIVYMILHGVKIDKLRVEVLVKAETPYLQEFTWDLTEFDISELTDMLQMLVSIVEGIIDGMNPAIAFRLNKMSYIGEDTNKLIDEIKDIIEESE